MLSNFRSAMIGFAVGLVIAGAGAQAAVQATQHEHGTPSPQAAADARGMGGMKSMEKMKGMDEIVADPAMRQNMMANMAQCRDMMSMMMEHMGHGAAMAKEPPQQPKH